MERLILLILLGVAYSGIAAEQEKSWWNEHWEYRIPFTVSNASDIDLVNRPIMITGKELFKKTGLKNIRATSIRLVSVGKEIAVQVDEKDGTGVYQKEPNSMLDKDDEIVFQVSIPAGKNIEYHLYASTKMTPAGEYSGDVKVSKYPNAMIANLKVSNPLAELAIKGPMLELTGVAKLIGESGCGAITVLKIKGTAMLHFSSNLAQCLPVNKHKRAYSTPVVLKNGAVRTIISSKLDAHTRFYILYSGVDLVQVEDNFTYTSEWDKKFKKLYYTNRYAAGIFEKTDTLLVPLGGKSMQIKMSEVKSKPGESCVYFRTAKPEAGWFAWFDTEKNIGMATFFPKKSDVVLMQLLPPEKVFGRSDANPYNRVTINVPPTALSEKKWTTGVMYAGISSEKEAAVYHDFQANPPIKFGFVEEQKK